MKIGIPKEIKNNENRVGMTPAGVAELVKHGHKVMVEHTAGEGRPPVRAVVLPTRITLPQAQRSFPQPKRSTHKAT